MPPRKRRSYKYRKPSKRAATTLSSKAHSMQTSWRTATAKTGTLKIEDAKKLIAEPPICPFCNKVIHWRELSIDHIQPRSRGGPDEASNLQWTCKRCNGAKGNLTGEEFKLLMALLNEHPMMRESVIPRLIAGGAAWGRKRRWQKK